MTSVRLIVTRAINLTHKFEQTDRAYNIYLTEVIHYIELGNKFLFRVNIVYDNTSFSFLVHQ